MIQNSAIWMKDLFQDGGCTDLVVACHMQRTISLMVGCPHPRSTSPARPRLGGLFYAAIGSLPKFYKTDINSVYYELNTPNVRWPLVVQRFFFELIDGLTTTPDVDGVLAENLGEAINQAQEVLQEMRHNAELSVSDEAWTVIIRDAVG